MFNGNMCHGDKYRRKVLQNNRMCYGCLHVFVGGTGGNVEEQG